MHQILEIIGDITTAPGYEPNAIRSLMARLSLNEKGFALLMNVTPLTVRLWTSGAAQPCGHALRLMQIYDMRPDVIESLAGGDRGPR